MPRPAGMSFRKEPKFLTDAAHRHETDSVTLEIRREMDATARAAWSAIADGDAFGLRLREDTVTEGALLKLVRRSTIPVLQKFNQTEEKSSGGDWAWFVGSRRHGWISFRLQAKRMDRLRYRQLGHRGQLPGERQYDTLLRDSAAASVPTFPFHVFFNGWAPGWPKDIGWNACPNGASFPNCVHHEMSDMGCSLLPATAVRDLHRSTGRKRSHVSTYLPTSVPWSWLFGPPVPRTSSRSEPADRRLSVSGIGRLLAWHETMTSTLASRSAGHSTGHGGSDSGSSAAQALLSRWVDRHEGETVAPEVQPAEHLPAYADWILRRALNERLRRGRLDGYEDRAWNAFIDNDELPLEERQQQSFETPSALSGVMFTPWIGP